MRSCSGGEGPRFTALGAQTKHDRIDVPKSPSGGRCTPAAAGLFTPDGAPAPSPSSPVRKGMCYGVGAHAPGWRCPCQGIAAPQLSEANMPGRWRHASPELPELTAPISQPTFISPPKDQAGSVSRRNSFFVLNGRVQKCSGKEGVLGGLLPLFQDTQKGGVLEMLWTPAINSRVLTAALQD